MDKQSQLEMREKALRKTEGNGRMASLDKRCPEINKSRQGENQKECEIGKRERQQKAKSVCGGAVKAGKMAGKKKSRKSYRDVEEGKETDRTSSCYGVDVSNPSQGGIWGYCEDKLQSSPTLALKRVLSTRWGCRQRLGSPHGWAVAIWISLTSKTRSWTPSSSERRGTEPGLLGLEMEGTGTRLLGSGEGPGDLAFRI